MTLGRILTAFIFAAALHAIFAPLAHAYLDPGTGSYIFQLLLAGVVGLAFVIKLFWGRIKGFFARLFSRNQAQAEEAPDD